MDACTAAPIKADRTVPISTGHGCESGLAGIPKSKTALAAREEAIHILLASPPHQRDSNPVTSNPKAMPTDMRNASAYPTRTDAGKKFRSHSPQRLNCARLASKVFVEEFLKGSSIKHLKASSQATSQRFAQIDHSL
ncbi:MAG: hypothetical protein RSB86_09585 [Comamonas sp.]|uniref:hypothetical protein n=1 Tax=Comamonas sp. TaxID=34028 RepID=UPI002FC6EE9E